MTKEEWIEEVRLKALSRANINNDMTHKGDEFKFHPVFIEKIINNIYSEIVQVYYAKNKMVNNSMFTKKYSQTVSTDVDGIKYLEYPANFIPIGDAQGAVRFIKEKGSYGITFEPIKDSDLHYFIGSEIESISEVVGYVTTSDRVDLFGDLSTNATNNGVYMYLVVPFEEYAKTDEIRIPEGQDEILFERAISVLLDDKINKEE